MTQPRLDIWMNGEPVGQWFRGNSGLPTFKYNKVWASASGGCALSLSLPIPEGDAEVSGHAVDRWFDNLLPDSKVIRERLCRRFGASSTTPAHLLSVVGTDCVGATQILPTGSPPPNVKCIDSESLAEEEVERLLSDVTRASLPDTAPQSVRLAIAGAQEKTALLRIGHHWHRPLGNTPTTHILKLPMGLVGNMRADMTSSVENEWLCAQILDELGFNVAATEIAHFGSQKVLVVERFDREWRDNKTWIARLPQEDFCQALGIAADLKYESDGGPGIRGGLDLLSRSVDRKADKLNFALTQLAFWLMAATDGHAKNFSIHLLPGGRFRAAPLYDVLSVWPIVGNGNNQISPRRAKLAMALRSKNVHYHLHEVYTRHWRMLAAQSGVPEAFDRMVALVQSIPGALDRVQSRLPPHFPNTVWEPIRTGMLAHVTKFSHAL